MMQATEAPWLGKYVCYLQCSVGGNHALVFGATGREWLMRMVEGTVSFKLGSKRKRPSLGVCFGARLKFVGSIVGPACRAWADRLVVSAPYRIQSRL